MKAKKMAKLIISPRTKVGELLENYPELEPVLINMSAAFEKLKNPILRRTVARVATLQQVAVVGGVDVTEMVTTLRKTVGQEAGDSENPDTEYISTVRPGWFTEARITVKFDASSLINAGESPMNEIIKETNLLEPGDIYELRTPFIPAPIIDILRKKGFKVHIVQNENFVSSFICRQQ
jgi:hypothetical protein